MSYDGHFIRLSSQLGCSVRYRQPTCSAPMEVAEVQNRSSCSARLHDQSAFQCKCFADCHPGKGSFTNLKCSLRIPQIISLPTRWPSDCKNYQCHIDDSCATLARSCGGLRAPTDPLSRGGIKSFLSRLSAQSLALWSNLAPRNDRTNGAWNSNRVRKLATTLEELGFER
jgi:hypothetical protein